ncbi:MAG: TonB-dependent receptor [Flavobacteriales bacterium CG_4_9_14_3_um_filter_32_8]|nr:MAG: TonB-dependent receptor [Flavobacteriales bacterium CG_4_9_14_3_um_filter_32_8]
MSLKATMKLLSFLIFITFSFTCFAQKINISNKETRKGISQVYIYNKSQTITALSDSLGNVDITEFSKKDTLIFTHPSYATFMIPKLNIGNTIYLKQQAINIPSIDIIAEKNKEKALEITSKIDYIESKTVQFNNPSTAADLLELSGGVYIQKSQMGGGSPVIRGFEANRVLLVVDGVRMNNAIYRSGHLQNAITIDNSILEKTSIIYGPNSVIYGSDAIGGVVHYETKSPQFKKEGDTINNNNANAYARYATANQEKTVHFDFNLGAKKIAAITSVTFSDFEDLRMGEVADEKYPNFGILKYYTDRSNNKDTMIRKKDVYKQAGTGYSQTDVLEKISFKFSEKVFLTLNTHYSTSSDIPRYDQLSQLKDNGEFKWAEWYYGPQNRLLTSLAVKIKSENNWFSKLEVLTHFQKIDEDRISRKFGSDTKTTNNEDINVIGINIDFIKENNNKSQWYYGFEAIHNTVFSSAFSEDIITLEQTTAATRYPDNGSNLTSSSAYLSFTNNFTKKATYSLGARYSFTNLTASFADTTFVKLPFSEINNNNGALTGNAGFVFHPNKKWNFQLAISTAFRNPNVDDVGKVFSKDDYIMIPNNQIQPEYAYNGELGITRTYGDNALILNAVGFYTILKNAIVRDYFTLNGIDSLTYDGDLLKIQANVNTEEAVVYGASFNLQVILSKEFSLKSSLNYTIGTNVSENVPLAHIPPIYGRTDLIVHSEPLTIAVYVKYQAWKLISDYSPTGEDNENDATIDGTPAWQTFNLRAEMKLSKSFSIQAAFENMLDVHYRPFASGVSGAGRNLIFTLRADI